MSETPTKSQDGWIEHPLGAPPPKGYVRIRHAADDGHWESRQYLPAYAWSGWDDGCIVAYQPEPAEAPSQDAA